MMDQPDVIHTRRAGSNHQVVTCKERGTRKGGFRKTLCKTCPWKKENTGLFPSEAFRLSANTAYDMSTHVFGCHEGFERKGVVQTCAGFLVKGSGDNLHVRLALMNGQKLPDVPKDTLHESYRDMAIANGVDPEDPVLKPIPDRKR